MSGGICPGGTVRIPKIRRATRASLFNLEMSSFEEKNAKNILYNSRRAAWQRACMLASRQRSRRENARCSIRRAVSTALQRSEASVWIVTACGVNHRRFLNPD